MSFKCCEKMEIDLIRIDKKQNTVEIIIMCPVCPINIMLEFKMNDCFRINYIEDGENE